MLIWCGIGAELGQNCVCHMVLGLPSKAFAPTPLPQMVSWLSTETSDQSVCGITETCAQACEAIAKAQKITLAQRHSRCIPLREIWELGLVVITLEWAWCC